MNRPERITLAIKESGKTKTEIAAACGVTPSSVTQWTTGLTQSIKPENLAALAKATGTRMEWLATGEGPMRPQTSVAEPGRSYELAPIEPWDDTTPLDDDEVEVPFFKEVEFAAGAGLAHQVELNHRKLRYSRATLRNAGVEPANAACATNTGTSMEPLIQDGATIGIDRGRKQIVDGEIYAIDHDGMLRTKYLYRLPGGGLRLRSENSAEFPDEVYDAEQAQRIRVLGWVWTWSTLRKWRGK